MLKKLMIICIGVLTSTSVMAQVVVDRSNHASHNTTSPNDRSNTAFVMRYGVKAGVNMTTMTNDMPFDPGFGMGVGFRAGAFLNLRWGQRTENSLPGTGYFGFQPEVMYSFQTVKTAESGNYMMHNITVPLMFKVYPTTAFSIELGPEFGFLVYSSPEFMSFNGANVKTGDFNGIYIGASAGIAYDLPAGLTLGARFTYVFNDIDKEVKWKHSNIQVTVGWMF